MSTGRCGDGRMAMKAAQQPRSSSAGSFWRGLASPRRAAHLGRSLPATQQQAQQQQLGSQGQAAAGRPLRPPPRHAGGSARSLPAPPVAAAAGGAASGPGFGLAFRSRASGRLAFFSFRPGASRAHAMGASSSIHAAQANGAGSLPASRQGSGGLRRSQRFSRLSAAAPAAPEAPAEEDVGVSVDFDNDSDPQCTVMQLYGRNDTEVLAQVTNVLTAVGLSVSSANINTGSGDGPVRDIFRITDGDGKKLAPDKWPELKEKLLAAFVSSIRSSKPNIFGMAAAADTSTLSSLASAGDPDALEAAAQEMASAAASLVSIERSMLTLSQDGADVAVMSAKQAERSEAASLLERRLAAIEALLTARRTVAVAAVEVVEPSLPDFMQPPPTVRTSGPAAGNGYEIILQGFNWESCKEPWYKKLASQAVEIAEAGFTAVWYPPSSDAVSPQGYLPRDLYDLNSKYGTEAELRDSIAVFHEQGIKVIADIVINHRCAHFQGDDGKWNKFGGRLAWDKSVICSNNPAFGGAGSWKNCEDYPAAPNIDHSQERVRKDISEWLRYLRNSIGFDGWRFDYVKGYEGRWIREYVDASVPEMAFGEYWDTCSYTDGVLNYNQDSHRQRTVDWCDATGGTSAAFDFTTKGILQEAVGRKEYWRLIDSQGRPPGMLGLWPSRAVTFLENHDTGSTLNHWPFPWKHLPEAYCYLLTHPGTPCVFYDHVYFDDALKKQILELVKIRKQFGIHAKSEVLVRKAYGELYAAVIEKKVAMKIGPGDWSPTSDKVDVGQKSWKLLTSGFQYAVWKAEF